MPITVDEEWLAIDGESTSTPACRPEDLDPLLSEVDRLRNEPMPYVSGRIGYKGWLDQLDVVLTWYINGFRDPDGVVYPDHVEGLRANREHYRALFRDGVDPAGRKAAELHLGASTVLEGMIQVPHWTPVRTGPATCTVVARIVLPAGTWTPVAP